MGYSKVEKQILIKCDMEISKLHFFGVYLCHYKYDVMIRMYTNNFILANLEKSEVYSSYFVFLNYAQVGEKLRVLKNLLQGGNL